MAEIKVATDANFEELVLKAERPVVVDFWAAWCGPCKMVAPEMEKLAAKYDGAVDVVKVDVDANPRLSQAFNILSIPTIAFFKPGAQPQGVVGFRPLEQLEQQFGLAEFAVEPPTPTEALPSPLLARDPGPQDRGRSIPGRRPRPGSAALARRRGGTEPGHGAVERRGRRASAGVNRTQSGSARRTRDVSGVRDAAAATAGSSRNSALDPSADAAATVVRRRPRIPTAPSAPAASTTVPTSAAAAPRGASPRVTARPPPGSPRGRRGAPRSGRPSRRGTSSCGPGS